MLLSSGDRIPTDRELEIIYGASRTPIRQALDKLATEGHIVRRPGRGTFVGNTRPGTPIASLSGFPHYYRNDYVRIAVKALKTQMEVPASWTADIRAMPRNQKTLHLVRVRLIESSPMVCIRATSASRSGNNARSLGSRSAHENHYWCTTCGRHWPRPVNGWDATHFETRGLEEVRGCATSQTAISAQANRSERRQDEVGVVWVAQGEAERTSQWDAERTATR